MVKRPARAYLGGPDVFRRDARAQGDRLKALCGAAGLAGVFPIDAALDLAGLPKPAWATRIKRANVALILGCDLMLANMEPWRGPGMDGGTAWEMGFAEALGLPVFGYTADGRPYRDRVPGAAVAEDGTVLDPDGLLVEDFDGVDNLMMAAEPTSVSASPEAAAHAAAAWWAALAEDDPALAQVAAMKRLARARLGA